MNNFKKLTTLTLIFLFVISSSKGFVPRTVINGTPYNVGLPYGVILDNTDRENALFKATSNAFYLYQSLDRDFLFCHEQHDMFLDKPVTQHALGLYLSASYNMKTLIEGLSISVHAPIIAARRVQAASEASYEIALNDIDVAVSYYFLRAKGQEGNISIGLTIPRPRTHLSTPDSTIEFGNNNRNAYFVDFDMKNRFISKNKHELFIVSGVSYHYLFDNSIKANSSYQLNARAGLI